MYIQILFCLFAFSLAAPDLRSYGLPTLGIGGRILTGSDNGFRNDDTGISNGGSLDISLGGGSTAPCGDSQALNSDGSCAEAQVSRKIFLFQAPEQTFERHNSQNPAPKPKLNYNIVFVRTPERPEGYEPVVIPPSQEKTVVYVLNKDEEDTGPQVIERPDIEPHAPEVFYINYREGDNPQLPIGVDLQTALGSAITEQGQLLIGGEGSFGLGGNIGTSSVGGFRNTISEGSTSFVNGGSGVVSGNGEFGGAISGGSISVGTGGIGGFANNRGISGQYAPPNPPNVYGTPLRN